ncbi:MAG: hypothetical protein LQ340_004667 [Diploschistes diacapsis]|nr:MAG: hypothetical protein LQ340_004667 [Diploschistes diacapsis]
MSQQISAKKQQELQLQYSTYKNNLQQLAQKVGDVEQEAEEHKYAFDASRNLRLLYRKCPSVPEIRDLTAKVLCLPLFATRLVLETLNPLPEDRKCFRMINGVLVERTVKDVIPVLKTNSDGLKKVLEELLKQYKKQQDDMEKWKASLRFILSSCMLRPPALCIISGIS